MTIHVATSSGRSIDPFRVYKSVMLSREQSRWGIELATGRYRVWATCAIAASDAVVFAKRHLESNALDLTISSGNQPVSLTLSCLRAGLYLTADRASVQTRGRGSIEDSKDAPRTRATGRKTRH